MDFDPEVFKLRVQENTPAVILMSVQMLKEKSTGIPEFRLMAEEDQKIILGLFDMVITQINQIILVTEKMTEEENIELAASIYETAGDDMQKFMEMGDIFGQMVASQVQNETQKPS